MSKKRISPFIIAIPALLLLFVFKLIPAFYSFIASLENYHVFKEIFGSPWAGFKNYSQLFNSREFTKILSNTLILNTYSILLTSALAAVLIVFITRMPYRWCKIVSIIIISIPAFIPITSYVGVFVKALSPNMGFVNNVLSLFGKDPSFFFAKPAFYPSLFAIMDSLRNLYIPVIIGLLICEKATEVELNKIWFVIIGYIAVRCTLLLSPDVETILDSYNPLIYARADVMDTFIYRSGITQSQYSFVSALWVTKTFAQLAINIVIYIILARFLPKFSFRKDNLSYKVNKGVKSIISIIGYLLFAILSISFILLAFIPTSNNYFNAIKFLLTNKDFVTSFFNTLMYSILSCLIYGFVTITLAYPLIFKTKLYPLFLIIVMTLANNIIGEFLFTHIIRMANTLYPIIMGSGLSVIGAFTLYFIIREEFSDSVPSFKQFIKAAIFPLITIMILSFIANWGSYYYQYAFINKKSLYGIGLFSMKFIADNSIIIPSFTTNPNATAIRLDMIRSTFLLLTSIIPVSLGIMLISLNKYFPLSAFSANIRKS